MCKYILKLEYELLEARRQILNYQKKEQKELEKNLTLSD